MNGSNDVLALFSRWYDRLVKNKMAGPALCIAGISIGYLLVQLTRTTPQPYDEHVGFIGLRMIDISALVFCLTMAGFCLLWLLTIKNQRARKTRSR